MRKCLVLCAAVALMSGNAMAEENPETPVQLDSGKCGTGCVWTFYDNGLLDISGEGKMDDYMSRLYFSSPDSDTWNPAPWYQYRESIKKINVDGISSIGVQAFEESNAESITISDTVTKLGDYALWSNRKLTNVVLPDTMTYIGGGAFESCTSLESMILPGNLKTIDSWVFGSAENLSDIIIPETTEYIGLFAFGNTSIKTLVIPESVETLGTLFTSSSGVSYFGKMEKLYCTKQAIETCENIVKGSSIQISAYEKQGDNYLIYDDKGNIVEKYADINHLQKGTATERYKYDSVGHLVGIFDGNGQRIWGKKIYTVEEAMEATKNGDKFHVYLTYK